MKTAERILVTSLALFNEQGEHNVTSVDIALELDISPGNLYYHFKGKEIIVSALFSMYQQQMHKLLNALHNKELNIEEMFYYLYLILDKNLLFRFLFRSPVDLADKYPEIAKPFARLLQSQLSTINTLLASFEAQGILLTNEHQRQQMVEAIGLVLTQSSSYLQMRSPGGSSEDQVYQSLALLLTLGLPYLKIETAELQELQQAITQHSVTSLVNDDMINALKD